MNTQLAFAFGMLAMTAITMLVVLVVGVVKVIKLGKQVDNIKRELEHTNTNIHHRIDEECRSIHASIEVVHSRISELHSIVDRRIVDEVKSIVYEIEEVRRITDSRFDKLQNKLVATTTNDVAATTKKQLLKD